MFKQLNIPLEMDEARYLFEKYDTNKNGKVPASPCIAPCCPSRAAR